MKLSTKKNRFPHTFSKARALECNYSVYVTRPCPASSGLASTSCAEGMQFKCNTSGEARAAHAISASATANKRNRVCVYVQYTKLQPPLVPPEFGNQGKYLQPYRPDE